MTMFGTLWALRLRDVTPLAKLVALTLGDGCDTDAKGRVDGEDLAEWCCAPLADVRDALSMLALREDVAWNEEADGLIDYSLPHDARPERRQRAPADTPGTIYVIKGRVGLKIGITRDLTQRVQGLRAATLDDTVEVLWSANHTLAAIRKIERRAHARLSDKLIRNEWFNVGLAEAVEAITAAFDEVGRI